MSDELTDHSYIPYIANSLKRIEATTPTHTATIQLRQWLIDNKMTTSQFAMRTGFNKATINNLLWGNCKSLPTLIQAFAIEFVTGGHPMAVDWMLSPLAEARVRDMQLNAMKDFEIRIKDFALKYKTLNTAEGMIRHKARILSRLFNVDWGEAKKRAWKDAREKAKTEMKDISHLMNGE